MKLATTDPNPYFRHPKRLQLCSVVSITKQNKCDILLNGLRSCLNLIGLLDRFNKEVLLWPFFRHIFCHGQKYTLVLKKSLNWKK